MSFALRSRSHCSLSMDLLMGKVGEEVLAEQSLVDELDVQELDGKDVQRPLDVFGRHEQGARRRFFP